MSERQNLHRIPDLAYEEAGQWFVLHREDALDAADRERFDAWLRCSPQNVQAYLEVSATWEDVPRLDPAWNPGAAGLIALDRRQANVIPLDKAVPSRPVGRGNGRVPRWVAYAASVVIAGVLIGYGMYAHRPLTYSTGIGEQRFIALSDGSRLKLNALSRVQLRFNDRERRVDLLEGQVLFLVAKDSRRPFVVGAGATRVQAVGTQFDVYRKTSGTVVTVIEGRVVVGDRNGAASAQGGSGPAGAPMQPDGVFLSAGQQLTVEHSAADRAEALAPEQVVPADIGAATAWTQQRLVFQSSPLHEVVEEFNRYNARPLSIADARLHDYRISGVFASTDPDPLLRFLRTQKGILVTESEGGIRISRQ